MKHCNHLRHLNTSLIMASALLLSACASSPKQLSSTPQVAVTAPSDDANTPAGKEIAMLNALIAAGCNVSKFEINQKKENMRVACATNNEVDGDF